MNKIFIDNEEVLCDSSYKIEEELKNPSSVILDKVYPKRWKGTNKLLTEFYFPKDYSNCLIYDEVEVPPPNLFNFDNFYSKSNNAEIVSQDNNQLVATVTTASTWQQIQYKVSNLETNTDYSFSFDFENTYDSELYQHSWMTIKGGTTNNNLFNAAYYKDDVITFNTGDYTEVRFTFHITINAPAVINTTTISNVQLKKVGAMPTTVDNLIFAGIVKNSGNMVLNPRKPHYCSLQILDYSTLLSESDTLDFVINNQTIPEAIEQVIDSISSYGFVIGNINIKDTTSIIGAYSTLDKTPYDVFEYLSEISQSVWFTRMIDENTIAIDFYDVDYLPQNDDIEYTREYFNENKINNIEYDYSTNDYRNKQIIKSSQVYGNVDYVETIIANGYDKTFSTSNNIGIINSIAVNGIEKTIGTEEDKEIGIEFDFYYETGKNTFENNENDSYTAGTQIIINYTPLIKGRELISNNSEILRINNQTQRKGTITRYENRDDILSADELNKVAQSYLKTYSNSEIVLKIDSSIDFLTLGSRIFFNAPLDDLKKEYLVKKKTTYIKQAGEFSLIKYEYELSSTFNLNNEINYFDNQRRKSEGNISSGEYITRNVDIEETANIIWDNLTITEVTPTGDNVLNSPLNSPFIQ